MAINWNNNISKMAQDRLSASLLGDLFAIEHKYKPICLSAGEPNSDFFPLEELAPFFKDVCKQRELFGYYPFHAGHVGLREWIKNWMKDDNIAAPWVEVDNIILTTGSQQGLALLSDLLVDEGDLVAVEAPTYLEASRAFRKSGANFIEVEADENGIIPESFEMVCKRNKPRLLYTIPNFQNPTGSVTSLERRKLILKIAQKYDVVIIEDDPYRFVSFIDSLPDSYMSLSGDDDRVIYLGSFSKIICPGVRCGWMIVPAPLVKKITQLRHTIEISLPASLQHIVYCFCNQMDRKQYFNKIQKVYKNRCDMLVSTLKETMAEKGLEINLPKGGYFIWSHLPGIINMKDFVEYSIINYGVSVTPGYIFYVKSGQGLDTLRFSFAKVSQKEISEGCERLARSYDSFIAL